MPPALRNVRAEEAKALCRAGEGPRDVGECAALLGFLTGVAVPDPADQMEDGGNAVIWHDGLAT